LDISHEKEAQSLQHYQHTEYVGQWQWDAQAWYTEYVRWFWEFKYITELNIK
jgi:hypothetical protein